MQKSKTKWTSPFGCSLRLMSKSATRSCSAWITFLEHYIESQAQRRRTLLSIILPLMLIVPSWAQTQAPEVDTGDPTLNSSSRQYLLGDWGGSRSRLADKGVVFDFFYISDSQGNPTGGLQQTGATWQRVRGTVDIDFGHFAERWSGLRFHATGLWQTGSNLGARIGTLANPSDLVSLNTARLDSFWLEQHFFDSKLRIRAGQLAGYDFYGNQEYGGSWLIEPLGYAFGNLFSSVYETFNPVGTPGAEVRFAPKRSFYVKTAVMAGNKDPYHQDPTGFEFKIRDTPVYLFETGYLVSPAEDATPVEAGVSYLTTSAGSPDGKSHPGVYKFGGAFNRGQFSDPAGRKSNGNYLLYGMASQALFRTEAGSNRGLDATFAFDWSPGDVSRTNTQITAGVRFNAPFRRRKEDRVACGFVYSAISDPFSRFGQLLGGAPLGSEKAFELNYSLRVKPYLLLEPTFQYYINVGGNPLLSNPAVFGLRTKITL
jgi:porin